MSMSIFLLAIKYSNMQDLIWALGEAKKVYMKHSCGLGSNSLNGNKCAVYRIDHYC